MMADVAIVGGGIVGCSCAYYLSLAGISSVVIEPGPIAGGATAAGMGHVVAMDDSEAQFTLTSYSQRLWDEIYPMLPSSADVRRTGTLWVAADDEELAHVYLKQSYYAERGVSTEALDEANLRVAEPNLRHGLAGALLVPQDSVIYPMPAARWLLDYSGAERIVGEAVRIGRGEVELRDGSRITAGHVVNAAAGRAPDLTPGLPIEPRKGHLAITDRYPDFVHRQIIELGYLKSAHSHEAESVAFNVQPRATGQLLIGSSRQYVGWDPSIDRSLIAKMLQRAFQFMPGLSQMNVIRTWAGYRAATPSKLPIIGRWPADDRLFIAAGHEGLGITTCTATGKLIADEINGNVPDIDALPFRPGVEHVAF